MAKITIYAMESWLRSEHSSLFQNVTFPDTIDKEALIENIMLTCGEFESLYANPDFLKSAVEAWAKKYAHTFERWANALSINYNPLDNYDRNETTTDHVESMGSSGSSGTDIDKVSAFDSNSFQNRGQTTTATEATGSSESTSSRTSRVHGNIGTVSTQALLSEELTVTKKSIIKLITDLFKCEFCIMLY